MMTMTEPLDGIKFDVNVPFSQTFQAGFGFTFSNTKPAKVDVTSVISFMDPTNMNPMQMNPDEMSMIQTRHDSTGFLEVHSKFAMGNGYSLSPEMFFMNNQVDSAMISLEFMKEWDQSHIILKSMAGMQNSFSFMQAINENVSAGFEFTYLPDRRETLFFYGAKYASPVHNFFFQYIPMGRKEDFNFGYLGRLTKKLNLFAELKGSMEGNSETLLGYRLRFQESNITGFINTQWKASTIYKRSIAGMLQLQMVGSVDLAKSDKPARFGMSLTFGGA